jgi:hypothetical protein
MNRTEFRYMVEDSASIIDLERRLRLSGQKFSTPQEFVSFVKTNWYEAIKAPAQEAWNAPPSEEFPTKLVRAYQKQYHLHGVCHGTPGILDLAPGVSNTIGRRMRSFSRPEVGRDYFYEENLQHLFMLDDEKEFKDHHLGKAVTPGEAALALGIYFAPAVLSSMGVRSRSGSTNVVEDRLLQCLLNSAESMEWQVKLQDYWFACELPQPLDFELSYLESQLSPKARAVLEAIGIPRIGTVAERSLWTAHELINKAKTLDNTHYLAGLAHVSQIAYFIHHPSYSFRHIDEYMASSAKTAEEPVLKTLGIDDLVNTASSKLHALTGEAKAKIDEYLTPERREQLENLQDKTTAGAKVVKDTLLRGFGKLKDKLK